ncbi:testis-expressed protein 51 [Tachyglossus aculeatus]|uniref:testis-expressed protein 51 n=1 Tax=Tachyglossus aculeatus TaxID=9261 RepID=UPI0018F2845A|nr:testis-expressed protein 51 [Tachyglossus aculeatus]
MMEVLMLLWFLLCSLPTPGEASLCLQCWEGLVEYDLEILLKGVTPGRSGTPGNLAHRLHTFLMDQKAPPKPLFLDQDRLEWEMAKLFSQLDTGIQGNQGGEEALSSVVATQGQKFVQHLWEASEELKAEACSPSCRPTFLVDVTNCNNCQRSNMTCGNPALCPESSLPQIIGGVVAGLCVLAAAAGLGFYFLLWKRRHRDLKETKEATEGPGEAGPGGADGKMNVK